jgi:hypothetical protein
MKTKLQNRIETEGRVVVSGWSREFDQAVRLKAQGLVKISNAGEVRGRAQFAVEGK